MALLFRVDSVKDMANTMTSTNASTNTGSTRTFTGILAVNPNSAYQYTLQGKRINLNLGSQYASWVGKMVSITVTYRGNNRFIIDSINLI